MLLPFSEFEKLTRNQKWGLINKKAKSALTFDETIERCKPNWIGPLYVNEPMPHYTNLDGTTIHLNYFNVYDGTLVDRDVNDVNDVNDTNNVNDQRLDVKGDYVEMSWKGYTCQLYDGTLKMCPVNVKTSKITGICNGVKFKIVGTKLLYGKWPGFLQILTF